MVAARALVVTDHHEVDVSGGRRARRPGVGPPSGGDAESGPVVDGGAGREGRVRHATHESHRDAVAGDAEVYVRMGRRVPDPSVKVPTVKLVSPHVAPYSPNGFPRWSQVTPPFRP